MRFRVCHGEGADGKLSWGLVLRWITKKKKEFQRRSRKKIDDNSRAFIIIFSPRSTTPLQATWTYSPLVSSYLFHLPLQTTCKQVSSFSVIRHPFSAKSSFGTRAHHFHRKSTLRKSTVNCTPVLVFSGSSSRFSIRSVSFALAIGFCVQRFATSRPDSSAQALLEQSVPNLYEITDLPSHTFTQSGRYKYVYAIREAEIRRGMARLVHVSSNGASSAQHPPPHADAAGV